MMAPTARLDPHNCALLRRMSTSLRSVTARQTTIFTATSGLTSLLGGVAKILLAGTLSPVAFGSFALATSLLEFVGLFFEFGLFLPAARLAALAEAAFRREIIGAALALFVPVGLLCCTTVLVLSFFVDAIFHVDAGDGLRTVAPLAAVYPFAFVSLQLAQGVERLHVYSVTSLLGPAAFTLALVLAYTLSVHMTVSLSLLLRSSALTVGGVTFVMWLRPSFAHWRRHMTTLVRQGRQYGFAVYTGRVLSIATYNMDVLMLGALANARAVAVYTLAGAVASAFGLPAIGLANALFARMTRSARLRARWLGAAWAAGAVGALAAWLACLVLTEVVLTESYRPILTVVIPLALAQIVRGVTSMYNSFLAAHKLGRELRNAGLVLTIGNVLFNVALIPSYGAMGAAWASLLALIANLATHVAGYRRFVLSGAP